MRHAVGGGPKIEKASLFRRLPDPVFVISVAVEYDALVRLESVFDKLLCFLDFLF